MADRARARRCVLNNHRGQILIETILVMVALLAVVIFAANYFRSNAIIRNLITGPWSYVQGMAENGVWLPPQQARLLHPNLKQRHASIKGDE